MANGYPYRDPFLGAKIVKLKETFVYLSSAVNEIHSRL